MAITLLTPGCPSFTPPDPEIGREELQQGVDEPIGGMLNVPVFLVLFRDTPDSLIESLPNAADFQERFFSDTALYSLHTYFEEVSHGRLNVTGEVYGWVSLPWAEDDYTERYLLQHLLKSFPEMSFGRFNNNTDSLVDVIVVVQPKLAAQCREIDSSLAPMTGKFLTQRSALTGPYLPTKDGSQVRDLITAASLGGDDGCDPRKPSSFGVLAHEVGHVLGLPELYARGNPPGPGIGTWGLMAMGPIQTPTSPAHLTAWSKAQLGWVTEVAISRDTVLTIGPIETSATSYVVAIAGTGRYLILENRQLEGSDRGLAQPNPWNGTLGPGLLIWRVDSLIMRERGLAEGDCWKPSGQLCRSSTGKNDVMVAPRTGLTLFRADGLASCWTEPGTLACLQADTSLFADDDSRPEIRWKSFTPASAVLAYDAGDPFPGSTRNDAFHYERLWLRTQYSDGPAVIDSLHRITIDRIDDSVATSITARIRFESAGQRESIEVPDGRIGSPLVMFLDASDEAQFLSWEVAAGRLPSGVRLLTTGELTGVPAELGTFEMTLTVRSSAGTSQVPMTMRIRQ